MYPRRLQRGSALIIAVFVLVVMLALGAGLVRLLSADSENLLYEVYGLRAFNVANSGAERFMLQIFPLNGPAASCPADTSYTFSAPELQRCRAEVRCSSFVHQSTTYFTVHASGICQTATEPVIEVQRHVRIEAKGL